MPDGSRATNGASLFSLAAVPSGAFVAGLIDLLGRRANVFPVFLSDVGIDFE